MKKDEQNQVFTVYLAGPIEFANESGLPWREKIQPKLLSMGIKAIIPNNEEKQIIASQEELAFLKKNNQTEYLKVMRQLIHHDLEFVKRADFLIVTWEGERMSGTIHEVGYAYQLGKPSYLVTKQPFVEIPGWFVACFSGIFSSQKKLLNFIPQIREYLESLDV